MWLKYLIRFRLLETGETNSAQAMNIWWFMIFVDDSPKQMRKQWFNDDLWFLPLPCAGPKKYLIRFRVFSKWAYPHSGPKVIDFVMILLINRKGKKEAQFPWTIVDHYSQLFFTEGLSEGTKVRRGLPPWKRCRFTNKYCWRKLRYCGQKIFHSNKYFNHMMGLV